ncbi:MAG TPA: hypothetical protein VNZ64_10880, partial [Candidatus Acidoferrum sp.]|nr:hypothetical protein [Candidatus Acidoferrum sp.]
MKPNTMHTFLGTSTPGAVEARWPRFARKRATILPLPGGEGWGEGELWGYSFSSLVQIRGAASGILSLTLALFGVVISSRADVLIGTNGERFEGKVGQETPDYVVFESELGGRLTISRKRIREMQRTPPPITDHQSLITNGTSASSTVPLTNPPSILNPSPGQNVVAAGEPSNLYWQPPAVGHDGADWIQLRSGEWLRGHLKYVQDRKVEFDSDELKDLSLDLKNVRQIYSAKPLFMKFEGRDPIYGTVVISNDVVQVLGPEQVSLLRDQLTGITPGGTKEINFWSGKASIGLNFQSGNSRQATYSASAELARRTPATVIQL